VNGSHLLNSGAGFWAELKVAFRLITSGGGADENGQHTAFMYTAKHTLLLALYATGIAAVVGLPFGCVLGLGRFRGRRALIAIGNALARVPPVVVGVFILVGTSGVTQYGYAADLHSGGRVFMGPLAGIVPVSIATPAFTFSISTPVFAQTLLALPIIIALSATALQRVPAGLLDQAQVFGASRARRGVLALREARPAVLAAVIVAMGVTITAVGALYLVGAGQSGCKVVNGIQSRVCDASDSLALSALTNWQNPGFANPGAPDAGALAFAYAELLIGIFVVLAATLTFLQQTRTSWIAGGQS
jgi:ABC-type tungstate transport system substrate-binding protein